MLKEYKEEAPDIKFRESESQFRAEATFLQNELRRASEAYYEMLM